MALSRRDLFRGGRTSPELRPPWALTEEGFLSRCTRCGDCVAACRDKLLSLGSGGFPTIGFARGGCNFCGDCAAACKPKALLRRAEAPAMPLTATVSAGCLARQGIACRVCGEWCDAGAIRFRPALGGKAEVQVDAEGCNGCGACVGRCPAKAVAMQQRPQEELAVCA